MAVLENIEKYLKKYSAAVCLSTNYVLTPNFKTVEATLYQRNDKACALSSVNMKLIELSLSFQCFKPHKRNSIHLHCVLSGAGNFRGRYLKTLSL